MKKLSLELGGKNAGLVFADVDFEKAIEGTVRGAFLNQGEVCLALSRIYVQDVDGFYEKFVSKFVEELGHSVVWLAVWMNDNIDLVFVKKICY